MAHTPGPWEAQNTAGHDIHGQTAVYGTISGEDVAIVYEGQANANLIKAAPTMLDALKEAAECLAHTGPETTIKAVDAAIKLATEGE